MTETIPGPRGLPIIGNLLDIWEDRAIPIRGLERFAGIYGPIYQITINGKRRIVCSSANLLEELVDEKRFVKMPPASISERPGPKGLFAARNEDPDWGQGHRILMPAFATLSVLEMFTDMKDIANQLILSWARKGPENRILATEDFTRLTLDTIALCTMSYRFNSFYQETMHPFVQAMNLLFTENTAKSSRPSFIQSLMFKTNAETAQARKVLVETGKGIIENRKANPVDKKDVLNTMIFGKDPKTGDVMRDALIIEQMITFLIAGHETTSGLLSFAIMQLLKNPDTYLKAQKEVDEIIGNRSVEATDISKLKYLNSVLRETARLTPTVPVLQKQINPAIAHQIVTADNGKYKIEPNDNIVILLGRARGIQRITAEYPGCWKPFGNGKRACIGRPFAWQEAMLVLAMILQNFEVKLDDPNYKPVIKQALTIKPDDLYIRVTPRKNMDATAMDLLIHSKSTIEPQVTSISSGKITKISQSTKPMTILYGSNAGTCQAFAQRLAADAGSHGFDAAVQDLDGATNALPNGHPVIVITSSYEGQPPDNAARFMEWLSNCDPGSLHGVQYTVFGCGHRDWSQTFHRIPKLADQLLEEHGAKRIAPSGFTDASKGNMYGEFEEWLENTLWTELSSGQSGTAPAEAPHVEISTSARASSLRYDVFLATVKENRVLTVEGEPTKCHMEIELPPHAAYECGDYVAVLPLNSEKNVKRIMAHFGLPGDAVVTIKSSGPSTIPANTPLSAFDVLRSYVELSQPATKKGLKTLAKYSDHANDKAYFEDLTAENTRFEDEITQKRTSLFNLLIEHPSVKLPFGEFLNLLSPLHVRQYSISSSPLANPDVCTITYGVIDAESLSDINQRFEGVTGTYLHGLKAGDSIQMSIRPTAKKTFRLPADPEKTPLLMFAAGTGVAPFRGFLQERAIQMESNPHRRLAPAVLFLGCRSQTKDRIYAHELDNWADKGVVDIKYAFSREKEASLGCAYVPERMLRDAEEIVTLWRGGARAYICGTRKFSEGVRDGAKRIAIMVRDGENGERDAELKESEKQFREAIQSRVASDVFD
ncbi:Oxidoreductase NAD-binding domain-containing protein [Cladophialophora immunda]|nr:Oxidoreductase NAD-binding domain-containing protein [Cladophialophora immunda]